MNLTQLTTFTPVAITQSDTAEYDPPLIGIVIAEADVTVKVDNEQGDAVTITIPSVANGAALPVTYWGRIRKVYSTNTSATDANMIGLQQL